MFDFNDSLHDSLSEANTRLTIEVLSVLFPGEAMRINNTQCNDGGIDWIVGKRNIDVKMRSKDFGKEDLALETWSSTYDKVGWTRDPEKQTDLVLWIWSDTRRYELVPFHPLREAFIERWESWVDNYGASSQPHHTYTSEAVFVPRWVVQKALQKHGGNLDEYRVGTLEKA